MEEFQKTMVTEERKGGLVETTNTTVISLDVRACFLVELQVGTKTVDLDPIVL